MESPGEYLKRERLIRGIPLEDVAKTTKIRLKILTSLERDEFKALPAQPFVKGFIQSYCKYLGLDVQDALLRYEAYLRNLAEKEKPALAETKTKEKEKTLTLTLPSILLLACIALLAIWGFSYLISEKQPDPSLERARSETTTENTSEPKKEEPLASTAAPEDTANLTTPSPASSPSKKESAEIKEQPSVQKQVSVQPVTKGSHTLLVEALKPTWIKAEVDGGRPFEVSLKKGEKLRWTAKERFIILIGNAGGVHAVWNGKSLGILGDEGRVIRVVLPPAKTENQEKPATKEVLPVVQNVQPDIKTSTPEPPKAQ